MLYRYRLLLVTSKAGSAILDRMLVLVALLFEGETPEGIANEDFTSDVFAISCVSIFLPMLRG
jgi:hypothetical protein